MLRILFAIFLMTLMINGKAQDIHYAQYQFVPMATSPALTGVMQESFRFTSNVRRQWNSIPNTQAWEQLSFSFDARKCFNYNFFGYGVQIEVDKMGPLGLSNIKVAGNLAYHHQITDDLHLSIGGSGGLLQYRLNNDAMTFDSQFGIEGFDADLPSLENFDTYNRTLLDISSGLLIFNTYAGWTAGFALHHVNQPTYSFLEGEDNRLGFGLSIHGSATIKLSGVVERNKLITRMLYRRQSTLRNSRQWYFLAGATWKHHFKPNNSTASDLGLGLSGRMSGHTSKDFGTFDALIPSVYLYYSKMTIGLSYDVNMSSAVKETHARGGWEVSVSLELGGDGNKCPGCPKF